MEPDLGPVDGYILYWGTQPGQLTNSVDVGPAERWREEMSLIYHDVSGLISGSVYIAVSAYNSAGEGPRSNEVLFDFTPETPDTGTGGGTDGGGTGQVAPAGGQRLDGDFDGDGVGDLLVAADSGTWFCYRGDTSDCTRVADGWPGWRIHVGDFDGDGDDDVFRLGESGSFHCEAPGIASGDTCRKTFPHNWRDWARSRTGDFDDDGADDLFLIASTETWFCSGHLLATGGACHRTATDINWTGFEVIVQDVNGDGIVDLSLRGSGLGWDCLAPQLAVSTSCVLEGMAGGNNGEPDPVDENPGPALIGDEYPGDFDGDGSMDVYVLTDDASYFCADGDTTNCTAVGDAWRSTWEVHVGDFDGNGADDLFLAGASASSSYVCNGPGIASTNTCVFAHNYDWLNWPLIVAGDFDGNGADDLYVAGPGANYFCEGPVPGAGPCTVTGTGVDWTRYQVTASDLNGDGISDILVNGDGSEWECYGPQIAVTTPGACIQTR